MTTILLYHRVTISGEVAMEDKYREKLRKLCKKGKFKALLSAVQTTEELG